MKNVIIRSISGIVYVALIVAGIFFGLNTYYALALILAIAATVEFHKIIDSDKVPSINLILDELIAISIITIPFYVSKFTFAISISLIIIRLIIQLYIKKGNPIKELGNSALAQLYIALPLAISVYLYSVTDAILVFSLFLFIWLNDTGAFCVGILFGKHRLFLRISPKKSWEGFWGGLFVCLIVAYILKSFEIIDTELGLIEYTALAAVISVFATFGDLIESMIKRSLNIKDSGNIIPGHGGILDRIDSLLLVSPAVIVFLIFIGNI